MTGNEAQQLMNLFQEMARDGKKQMEQSEQKRKRFMKPLEQEASRQAVNKGKEVGGQIYDGAKQARDNRVNDIGDSSFERNSNKLRMDDFKESAKHFDFKDGVNLVKDAQVENSVKADFKANFEKEQIDAIKNEMSTMSPKQQDSFLKHLAQTDKFKEDPIKFSNALGLDNKQKDTVLKSMVNGPDKGFGAKISERKNEKVLQRTGKEALAKAQVNTVADSIKKNGMNLAKSATKAAPVVGKVAMAKDVADKVEDKTNEDLENRAGQGISKESKGSISAPFSNKELEMNFFEKNAFKKNMDLSAGITNVGAEDKATKAMVEATKNEIANSTKQPVKDVKSLISDKKDLAEQAAKVNPTAFVSNQLKDNMKEQMNDNRER